MSLRIAEINDPIKRFIAFIIERECIRLKRFNEDPWPWTDDEILQQYRFTNVHREDDAVSKHYQSTIRNRYQDSPLVIPGTVLYRWFNRPSTCDALFNEPDFDKSSRFEHYMGTGNLKFLYDCINNLPPPHVTGAFIITGKPGYKKSLGVLEYFHEWCNNRPIEEQWNKWKKNPPLLSELYEWVDGDGLGSFMRGQIVADLKYLPFMENVADWWNWATPGPGSLRGLNIVLDKPMFDSWSKNEWLVQLIRLSDIVTPVLEREGISRLHNQDLQNCLCEFSKYTKVVRGIGRPRQVFRH
jgi:hypothetical protein